ncbi:hypothetical protein GCM10027043_04820 [Ferruginibacter profundus]
MLLVASLSCSKKSSPTNTGQPVSIPVTPLINLPQGWKYSPGYSGALPYGMQVYTFDSIFAGRNTKAYCLAYDSKISGFEFKPTLSTTARKPSDFFAQEPGVVYASINGGFFGGNQSYSLVKYNNVVGAVNIKSVNRNFNGNNVPYYPTRAAFGVNSLGVPGISWIYHVGAGNENIFSYPNPSPNVEGSQPQQVPAETFPAGGTAWDVVSAIGGSPVLLQNGTINITDKAELINIDNSTSRARSAIGYNDNRIIMILAVEGVESTNPLQTYVGLNLAELAAMLQSLGCSNAINLDGGGSTSMVIGNKLTVRPSDSGVERPVMSVILIKKK